MKSGVEGCAGGLAEAVLDDGDDDELDDSEQYEDKGVVEDKRE